MMTKTRGLIKALRIPLLIVAVMWCVKLGELTFALDASAMGILPRTFAGLQGIIWGPFIHGNMEHLMANTVPILVLGAGIWYFYHPLALRILILSWLLAGLWTWAGGRPAFHIGASSIIYAFAAFLFFSGIFRKHTPLAALSLIVVFLYGSMIWGLFPLNPTLSWEGHLSGALAGTILAYYFRRTPALGEHKTKSSLPIEKEETLHFDEEFHYFYNEKDSPE